MATFPSRTCRTSRARQYSALPDTTNRILAVTSSARFLEILARSSCAILLAGCAIADGVSHDCARQPMRWSDARTIWSSAVDSLVFNPVSAASGPDGIFAVGEYTGPAGPVSPRIQNRLFGFLSSQTPTRPPVPIQPPMEGNALAHPLVAITPNGGTTVVWGEAFAYSGDTTLSTVAIRSLWAATLDGNRWSRAERIASEGSIRWNGVSASNLVVADDGSLHLAVPSSPVSGGGGVLYLTKRGTKWHSAHIGVGGGEAAYASLAVRNGRILLAYVAPVLGTKDLNSVWVTSSNDEGRSWTNAVLVSRSGARGARDPRIVMDSASTAHLIWGQNYRGGLATDAIRIVSSANYGATWNQPADFGDPYVPDQLKAALLSSDGAVNVLFSNRGGDELVVARWCGGRWRGAASVPGVKMFAGSAVLFLTGRSISALWSDVEVQAAQPPALRWRLAAFQ
jgi:hypothetical protein